VGTVQEASVLGLVQFWIYMAFGVSKKAGDVCGN
jgi:hypothetical protein